MQLMGVPWWLVLLSILLAYSGCDNEPTYTPISTPSTTIPTTTTIPTPEPPSPKPDPIYELRVSIDNEYGDRFKPVVVTVEYTKDGEREPYTYRVPYGDVVDTFDGFLIYGDGQAHENLVLTINNDEEYIYQLRREPRCGKVDMQTDCTGYSYRGTSRGYIYYDEPDVDQQVVYWGLAYTAYDNTLEPYEYVIETDGPVVNNALYVIKKLNEIYDNAGIFIRYYLETALRARYMNNKGHTSVARDAAPTADLAIGVGVTCPEAGGCAQVFVTFREGSGMIPSGTAQRADIYTIAHELGHMVGLAHGLDNSANPAAGYIWPDFGQGYSTPFCGSTADLMSYHPNGFTHNNSLLSCLDGSPAGSREISDSAYHLNRVRYDVSLIGADADAPPQYNAVPDTGPLIID
jgi:hypothetical protein